MNIYYFYTLILLLFPAMVASHLYLPFIPLPYLSASLRRNYRSKTLETLRTQLSTSRLLPRLGARVNNSHVGVSIYLYCLVVFF